MINYQFFPRSRGIDADLQAVVDIFKEVDKGKDSSEHLASNDMLALVRSGLEGLGYLVEKGKGKDDKIPVPALFGENNEIAYAKSQGIAVMYLE